MAKYSGKIGFFTTTETEPGIWEENIIERPYRGDVVRNTSRFQQGESTNDDININNSISIVSDPFANENFQHMRYVTFMKSKWKISNIEIQYPRIILTLGGLYHEK